MILSLSTQASIFLITIAIGIIIGLIYDVFRIIRKIIKHNNFLVNLEDIVFWIISTFVCFYILLHNNNLEFRFYLLLGIFIGLVFYFVLISYYVLKMIIKLLEVLAIPVSFFVKITKPFYKSAQIKKNKAIYKEKIFLQKVFRYGKIKSKDIKSTIKIILDKI